MLNISEMTYRIGGRVLLEDASASLPTGHKVGLVGRNGTGKSTLLKLILGDLIPESGTASIPRTARIGTVAQEAPGGKETLLEVVMAGDVERTQLMAEAETAKDPNRISEIQVRLADIEAYSAESRAAVILAGLGFTEEVMNGPCSALSGGWRMRVALAAALFGAPDVLLLDEPTNYLDLEGTIWLQSYIRDYPHTILLVSHDRDLLNVSVDAILHLDQFKLTLYQGNYDNFERQRREKQALNSKMKRKQDDQRAHMQAFVDRFKAKASKARQAQSRMKALAKLEPIADMIENAVAPFIFPNPEKQIAPPLVAWDKVSVGYGDKTVLKNITLRMDPDDRIALLGSNGNGKSTFAKLLCGNLKPMLGSMTHPSRLSIGYFAQHQLDELSEDRTPFEYISELMPDAPVSKRRAKLGAVGFGVNLADSKCSILSGGEKARLLFFLATYHAPHVLVMDEPTNHLDIDSREALILAINDYEGAVVLISHDRHIIETCVDRLWIVNNGTVQPYDGDMDEYTDLVLGRNKPRKAAKVEAVAAPIAQKPKLAAPVIKKMIQELDIKIMKAKDKLIVLDQVLADPMIYKDEPKKAADYGKLRTKFAKELETFENEWLELSE
jgi:ATP-binding cassette, subfamily F, member 3